MKAQRLIPVEDEQFVGDEELQNNESHMINTRVDDMEDIIGMGDSLSDEGVL